jgi:hypothetical protein
VLDLRTDVVVPVLEVIVRRLFDEANFLLRHHCFLLLLAFFLVALPFGLLFLQLVLGPLCISVIFLTLVVKDSQLLLPTRDNITG